MVVFTCNHCGESLQKPRVEKHYTLQCRRPKSLTCVDCFKDFKNEEYVVHTKCITEEERYAAKGSFPRGVVKKGEIKQESWSDMIKSIVQTETDLKPSLRNLFNTISNYSNVPRKKVKFINFLKSSTGGRVNFNDIEAAWDLIEKHKNEQKQENGANIPKKKKSEEDPTDVPKKKMKKEEVVDDADIFSFKGTILKILEHKGTIPSSKLQKKVLNAYVKETGIECTEKTIKKYNKKLKKLPNVTIEGDTVSLIKNEQ